MELLWLKLLLIPLLLLINTLLGFVPFCLFHRKRRQTSSSSTRPSSGSNNNDQDNDSSQPLLHRSDNESQDVHVSPPLHSHSSSHTPGTFSVDGMLSLANCFSAGVFLSTCFVGLLPSVQIKYHHIIQMMQSSLHHNGTAMAHSPFHLLHTYPLPEVSVCMGFFLIWTLKICLNYCLTLKSPHKANSSIQNGTGTGSVSTKKQKETNPFWKEMEEQTPLDKTGKINEQEGLDSPPKGSLLKSLLLLMALSSHSVIEGVAFGLLDRAAQVINVGVAMLLHETLCTFCLSVNLARDEAVTRISGSLILIVFSLLIPLGILAGMLLHVKAEASIVGETVSMMFQGIASGTFLFIVFLEILPSEMKYSSGGHHGHSSTASDVAIDHKEEFDSLSIKLVFCILGFMCTALLRLFHSHG